MTSSRITQVDSFNVQVRMNVPYDPSLFSLSIYPIQVFNPNYNPIYQTPYAISDRTRAYADIADPYGAPNYTGSKGTPGETYGFNNINPVECLAKGVPYYVEFLYENNSTMATIGEQQVTFFLSEDDLVTPTDPNNPAAPIDVFQFANSLGTTTSIDIPIGPINQATGIVDPSIKIDFSRDPAHGELLPPYDTPPAGVTWANEVDYWSHCFEPTCTVSLRRSKMLIDDGRYLTHHGLGITHRSRILIPNTPDIPAGKYYLGVYVGPIRDSSNQIVPDDNLGNNATYMELELVNTSPDCG